MKRIENQKKPKKDEIPLPPRKVDFELVEVSDDEDLQGGPSMMWFFDTCCRGSRC